MPRAIGIDGKVNLRVLKRDLTKATRDIGKAIQRHEVAMKQAIRLLKNPPGALAIRRFKSASSKLHRELQSVQKIIIKIASEPPRAIRYMTPP